MEGANRPPRSRRFAFGKPSKIQSKPFAGGLRGVRTLSSVLQQVLAELQKGGMP
jgi:hypothetical protein